MPIGTDIVQISRFDKIVSDGPSEKIFTHGEKAYILSKNNPSQTAAGIFAAKEALSKVFGTGIGAFALKDAEVTHDRSGAPSISLRKSAAALASTMGLERFEISISHDGGYAVAVVRAESGKYFEYCKNALKIYADCADNVITPERIRALLPKRAKDMHKGTCGSLFALAGSKGLTGAAIMSCLSALKCGAGLITLGCCESLDTVFEISMREVMTKPLPDRAGVLSAESADITAAEAAKADACLMGPGLGKGVDIEKIVLKIIDDENVCAVADADALNAMAKNMSALKNHGAELILTPHIGEFARLTGLKSADILNNTEKYASQFAKEYNVTLVLKSHRTVVADKSGECLVNISGNPGMATGGSGDVLAGAAASFAAQGLKPFDAACAGVFVHSLAADMAALELGEYSLTPSDIIDFLPYAVKYSSGR